MYDITVLGRAERTLRIALRDISADWSSDLDESTVTLRVADQSALIAALGALHDLGVSIEAVRRVH